MKNDTLRSIVVAALLCAGTTLAYAQSSNVTFGVDMSQAIENCALLEGYSVISVNGSFNDWSAGVSVLTHAGGGIYTGTFEVPNGEIQYKFFGSPEYRIGWEDGDNRVANITEDTMLDVAVFNKTFTDMCAPEGQGLVTFQVDMTTAIENCAFLPDQHVASVPGSFGDPEWTPGVDVLADHGGNGIYSGTFAIDHGDIAYKFHGSGPLGWEDGDDWTATIDGDVVFDPVAFRWDVQDFCQAQEFDVVLSVDMSIQEAAGFFDPDVDRVFVSGAAFGDWPEAHDDNELFLDVFNEDPWIYTGSFTLSLAVPSSNEYKFQKLLASTGTVAWESIANRVFQVTGEEPDNMIELPVAHWDNVGPEDVLTEETTVRYEVDLRPAFYFVMDNGELPHDIQTGEGSGQSVETLFINGPLPMFSQEDTANDWVTWGPDGLGQIPTRQFHDDGTNGDQVAGDSLYTRMYTFPAFTARTMIAKFGVNAYDNESGFAMNQHMHIEEGESVVTAIFGCVRRADGTFTARFTPEGDDPGDFHEAYQEYLVIDNTATPATCEVVRSGGGTISAEPTGREPDGLTLFANYPNPVSGATTIEYSLPMASQVRVEVFDVMGRRVSVVVDEFQQPDTYRVRFDANGLASGTYLYRLVAGDRVLTQRMTVIR